MKPHYEKCSFSGGSYVEDGERNMSEYAGSSGESILNIEDSEDYQPSRSPSFSIVSELSANDSVSVTSCMSHSHSISPVAKRKKNLHHPQTIDKFVIRTNRLQNDEKIAQFVYVTNSPFRMIENPHFMNMVQSLRPGYSSPNRADAAGKLLDKVSERETEQCAKGLEGKIVNLSLDGWSNVHNDPAECACVTTEEGKVFLTETTDTSGNAHTAEYLQEVAVKAITNCEKKFKCLARSLVTVNAANVTKLRRNYLGESEESPKLITYGCSAHLMHLLAKDFSVPVIKANVVEIAKYFRNNHFAAAALKKVGGTKPTLPQVVRWNSVVDCFEHHIKIWPNLTTVCEQTREKIDGTVTAKVLNLEHKRNVEHLLSTLKPISVALNKMQGNSCFIADAVEIWKRLSEILKREICDDRVKLQALKKTNGTSTVSSSFFCKYSQYSVPGSNLNCRRGVGYDMDIQQSSLHNANYNKLQS
ncbi:uncharacterized protein RBU57_006893 [Macrochelys suwanniensis]